MPFVVPSLAPTICAELALCCEQNVDPTAEASRAHLAPVRVNALH